MISDIQLVLTAAWSLFTYKFTLYGFELSFAQVLFWTVVAGLILWFGGKVFDDG